jgi:hypothetical protein
VVRPPTDLSIEVQATSGARFLWDQNQSDPGDRPSGLTFRTKLGEGFTDASLTLARRIDRDYRDLELLNKVVMRAADGSVVYEGFIVELPRTVDDDHSISVSMTGWMAHAKDRKFTMVYVDRDLGAWGGMSTARRGDLLTGGRTTYDAGASTDETTGQATVTTSWTGAWSTFQPQAEAWYDAGPGNLIGRLNYSWKRQSTQVGTTAPWFWQVYASENDRLTGATSATASLVAAGPSVLQTFTPTTPLRYLMLVLGCAVAPAGADGAPYGIDWSKLAVYGNHGLTLRDGEPGEPAGVYASDVIKDIASRYSPLLDTSGVQDTTYVIQHLVWKDRTAPYDAFLQLNKYHLWNLGVWEDQGKGPRLVFEPIDLTDWDWEVRLDDQGVTFQPQGVTAEDVFNGITVSYQDVLTGTKNILTPDVYPQLADASPVNPWNLAGRTSWDELELSYPTTQAQALAVGQIMLAEQNRPKAPGTLAVREHVRDRAGNWQPASKVRAGDTVAITSLYTDAPRLIHETTYDDEQDAMTMALDAPPAVLDAYIDRLTTGLQARGLG